MFKRFRRLRMSENLRALVRESAVSVQDFIYPLFVVKWAKMAKLAGESWHFMYLQSVFPVL